VYAMDCKGDNVVVGTADKNVSIFNLRSSQKVGEFKSQLAYQTRCISIFSDNQGFAMGCIEGRVAIEYFDEVNLKNRPKGSVPNLKSFVFKCHRDGNDIFAVNAIDFHQ
jgi:mRNA export factor